MSTLLYIKSKTSLTSLCQRCLTSGGPPALSPRAVFRCALLERCLRRRTLRGRTLLGHVSVHSHSLVVEDAQHLSRALARGEHGMRDPGVELGRFAAGEHE